MNKIIELIKQYKVIIIIALAAIACFIFYDWILEIVLGVVGLGAVAVAAKKHKAKEAEIVADEHENMADAALIESVKAMNEAKASHDEALVTAKKTAGPKKVPPGFKKKKISSR